MKKENLITLQHILGVFGAASSILMLIGLLTPNFPMFYITMVCTIVFTTGFLSLDNYIK